MKEVFMEIDEGNLTAKVKGVPGSTCLELTQGILDQLGGGGEVVATEEMYDDEAEAYVYEEGS